MICCSWPIITTYKSVLAMFVLLTDPKVIPIIATASGLVKDISITNTDL